MRGKKEVYNDYKAERFLSKYVPVGKNQLIEKVSDLKIKVPLVMKIVSDQALHKSDIGGVRIVKDSRDIENSFKALVSIAEKKKLKYSIMAQQYHEGEQFIIGIKKDPVFGHVILFGVGGVLTELLKDTSTRKCPITMQDAQEMIDELKVKQLFYGFRGKKLNINLMKKTLVKISQLPIKYKRIEEMDINPFILDEEKGVVVDARIVFN